MDKPTIASEWASFLEQDISPEAPPIQVIVMRQAFYAGVASGVKLGMVRTPEANLREMNEHIAAEDRRRARGEAPQSDRETAK